MDSIDYKNVSEVVETIKALVPCVDMQNILFDCKNGITETSLLGMNLYMRNIITMSFVLTYTRWKQIYKNENDELKNKEDMEKFRASRYSTIFESIDKDENLNLDIMVFALIEVWVSARHADDVANRVFDKFFSKDKEDLGVVLQKALKFSYMEELDMIEVAEQNKLVCEVLEGMEIFSYLEMKNREDRNDFFDCRYRKSGIKYVELSPNKNQGVRFICLKGYFDYAEGKTAEEVLPKRLRPYLRFGYSKLSDEITYSYRTFDEQYYRDITLFVCDEGLGLNVEQQKVDAIHQLLAFNYKRLRDFSLVICDSINKLKVYKKKIFDLYKDKYRTVFPDGLLPKEEYMWDNVVTLLLVELGPTEFLQSIIDETLFDQIMSNIKMRYMTDGEYDEIKRSYDNGRNNVEKLCAGQKKFKDVLQRRYMASTIVKTMHKNSDNIVNEVDFGIYEESLAIKYDKVKILIKKLNGEVIDTHTNNNKMGDYESIRRELESTLSGILKFLQMFYAGIIGYINGGEDGFINAAIEKKKQIENLSLSKLFDMFVDQCDKASKKTENDRLSDESKCLKKVITRTYICDVKKLKYFTQIQCGNETLNIFSLVENLSKYSNSDDYNKYLEKILGFFIFLVFNDDCETSDKVSDGLINQFENGQISEKEIDPIYPYIVSYFSENTDRDEVKRCNYKAYFPAKYSKENESAETITVTLLTERDYKRNSTYYCMPLKYGSTKKWWIEPFMVPTSIFKKILKEERNESYND